MEGCCRWGFHDGCFEQGAAVSGPQGQANPTNFSPDLQKLDYPARSEQKAGRIDFQPEVFWVHLPLLLMANQEHSLSKNQHPMGVWNSFRENSGKIYFPVARPRRGK